MNGLALIPHAVGQRPPSIVYATVSENQPLPATFTDPLYLVEPHRPQIFHVVTAWLAHSLPVAGAPCTLLHDNYRNLVALVWAPGTVPAPQ